MSDWKTKLKEAKEMLEMGLLEQDEFDALKAELKQEALNAMRGGGASQPVPSPAMPTGLSGATMIQPSTAHNPLAGATIVDSPTPAATPVSDLSDQTIGDYRMVKNWVRGAWERCTLVDTRTPILTPKLVRWPSS